MPPIRGIPIPPIPGIPIPPLPGIQPIRSAHGPPGAASSAGISATATSVVIIIAAIDTES